MFLLQEKIVKKMESLQVMLAGVKNLETFRCEELGEGRTESHPLFQSWSILEFGKKWHLDYQSI